MVEVAENTMVGGQPQPRTRTIPDDEYQTQQNERTIEQLLDDALDALNTIINSPDIPGGNLTAAQLSNHVRSLQAAVKLEARVERRLIFKARERYTTTD